MISWKVFFIFLACFCAIYNATKVSQCRAISSKTRPVMTEGSVGNCVTPPCELNRGDKVWINMTFTADDAFSRIYNNIYGTVIGVKHGYPGLNGLESCNFITPACPLKKGQTYKFGIELEIKKNFPMITVPLHFAIKDKRSGREIACFECIVKIV